MRVILKKTEATLTWSKNGIEAIKYCNNTIPDIILMDIKMPNMDGYETISKLREMKITSPIIAQTAYARLDDENKILNFGFDAYLSKPIEKEKLLNTLNRLISIWRNTNLHLVSKACI